MSAEIEPIYNQPKWIERLVRVFVILAIMLLIYAILAPMLPGRQHKPSALEFRNANQIGLALFEFQSKFGSYPSDTTVSLVNKEYPNRGYDLSGKSSNTLLRQLIASKIIENEEIFYARIKGITKPDGDYSAGQALKKGEVGFAYISGLTINDNPSLPLIICPIIPGTKKFDPKPFNGKAIALRIDGSVSTIPINKNGEAMFGNGESLLDPNNKFWNGKIPDIRYPE